MCLNATVRKRWSVLAIVLGACLAHGQVSNIPALTWRHIGNSAIARPLPSLSTGPVDRVWFSADGTILYARIASGSVFKTQDGEQWQPAAEGTVVPEKAPNAAAQILPERSLRRLQASGAKIYAIGQNVYRSEDGGLSWSNLTEYRGSSILGGPLIDIAVSPTNPDELVVSSTTGVWHSADDGLSWAGWNQGLPALPGGRFAALPSGAHGLRISLRTVDGTEVEWSPGERSAWRPVPSLRTEKDAVLKENLEQSLQRFTASDWGSVQAIWVDSRQPAVAIAVLSASPRASKGTYVVRTMNGGLFWDDMTANLPNNALPHGVAADLDTGAIYVATDAGVFYTRTDLRAAGQPTPWALLSAGLPDAPALDVALDTTASQLYVLLDGYGVYTTLAPHRFSDVKIVNAADFSSRPAAPGSLLSVLGTRVESASSSAGNVPVLAASEAASQIQVPFEAKGSALSVTLESAAGRISLGLPLKTASPAVFVDPDGTPLLLDADTGMILDASQPTHANARIQVLATGLGQVKPDWPTGMPAPVNDPPKVLAPVHAFLDGIPVQVRSAVLGPYAGYYLVEIQLPSIVNSGPAEFQLEVNGETSNPVRLYVEP